MVVDKKRWREREREGESLNFNIFRRQLFSNHYAMWVQKVYDTHNKIELKVPNDDSNECKITQNSSDFTKIHFQFLHSANIWDVFIEMVHMQ